MKSVSGKKLCKIVEQKGWVLRKVTGSHHIYEKAGVGKILSILIHSKTILLERNRNISVSNFIN